MSTVHDVVIIGAGLSGVGAACRLRTECPDKSFVVLEARDAIGGTWDLFRYPGIRSDSDMFTLGYPFRPWREGKAIADGSSILRYIRETATEYGIEPHIRFRHRLESASWSSKRGVWTLVLAVGEHGEHEEIECRFLYLCSGYYDYEEAHNPRFEGVESFRGTIVHPQWWPDDLDYAGKRIAVIGSGATAVTLVPALSERAAHVTMVQRSPSYITSLPARDRIADVIRKTLPPAVAHRVVRGKNVLLTSAFYQFCRRFPKLARRLLRKGVAESLPEGFPLDPHFSPRYDPWDQRLCLVPDADLFETLSSGKASIVTDTIERFTESGLRLTSGEMLEADIIVTATGLKVVPCGGASFRVDDRQLETGDLLVYKGLMLGGVPNLAMCVGYTNASWTLRADLSSLYVCRLLRFMDRHDYDVAVAEPERGVETRPLLELSSGYITRAASRLPKQGTKAPWYLRQNYILDLLTMRLGRVDDPAMSFARLAQSRSHDRPDDDGQEDHDDAATRRSA